ncbi:MAG: translocation/assembly module TamB domain-containing protein [Bacteroidia bacterium]
MHSIVELLVLLLLFLVISVRFHSVQTYLANKVLWFITQDCNSNINIAQVDTDFIRYVRFKDIHITDHKNEPFLKAETLWLGFPSLLSLKDSVVLSDVIMEHAEVNFIKYDGDSIDNLTHFINCFPKSEGGGETSFKLSVLHLEDVDFLYKNERFANDTSENFIDFDNIFLTDISLRLEDLIFKENQFSALFEHLRFKEKSGFEVKELMADRIVYDSAHIGFYNMNLQTPKSNLRLEEFSMKYNELVDFSDYVEKIVMHGNFSNSILAMNDLKYFHRPFANIHEDYKFKGHVDGTISELTVNNFYLEKLSNSEPLKFIGDATITGLPDSENAFYRINAKEISTNKNGIENLQVLSLGNVNIKLPTNISRLGNINGKGFFRGYIQGFVSEFDFKTNLGIVKTDLNFYFDEYNQRLIYDGSIATNGFNMGYFYNIKELGKVSGKVEVNAVGITIDKLKTTVEGRISEIYYNNYNYKNIRIDGVFEKNHFDGTAQINDKNLVGYYEGNIDFKQAIPAYKFCMTLNKANLFPLGLRNVEDAFISLNVDVEGSGFDFTNLNGNFQFFEVEYRENQKKYLIDSLVLASNLNENSNSIKIWSEILDASLEGKYNLEELPILFQELASKVLPRKIHGTDYNITEAQKLHFEFDLKDVSALTHLFALDLEISPHATFTGNYNSIDEYFDLVSNIDYLYYQGFKLNGIKIETQLSDIFEVEIYADSLKYLENKIENVEAFTAIFNNNIGIQFNWKDSISNGEIGGNGYWNELENFTFDLHKANINTKQQNWHLNQTASITQLDSLKYSIKKFQLANKNQLFTLEGILGDNFSDMFSIKIDSVKLNDILPIKSYKIEGDLDAFVQIRSALKNPMFIGRLSSNLKIEDIDFGNVELQSWMTGTDTIHVTGALSNKNIKSVVVDGNYYVKEEKPLDLAINFSNYNIEQINIFLPNAVSNLRGDISGNLNLTGSPEKPDLVGNLNIKDGNIKVSVLNTEYSFEGNVEVTPDYIYSDDAKAYDMFGNQANILSASFYHNYFKEYSYDFSVHMFEPILALNTTYEDNSLFYGKAFATGYANISYDKYNKTEIEVEATSHKGTKITLPLYGAEDVTVGNFVSFVKFNDTLSDNESELNLTGISMNFNLTATPDAEIKMVFDELVGDEIVAYGSGNIYMEIDQYDQFKMYGQYELEKGEYLFTLKDLINKKFDLTKGGTVAWYGDPYNAEINIDALYSIKASVADLFSQEERQKYSAKQEVDCHMLLTNSLFSPSIGFEIALPNSSDQIRSVVKSSINTKEELERQFFSLLLMNKFVPRQSSSLGSVGSGVSTSTSELLTNQVNQILDKWIEGVDVGINYSSGDELTNEEYALALSTQLFSEKLLLSGNFGVSQNNTTTEDNSTVIGDVTIEYIIDEKGIWRVKAFNQSNTYDPTRSYQGNYTQGVGISYQKSYDSLNEIYLWNALTRIFGKKK